MKNLIVLSILFSTSSFFAQNTPPEVLVEDVAENELSILGTWQVDTIYFINSGVRGEGSTPIVPTSWTFNADGSLIIENTGIITSSYQLQGKELTIDMFGTIMENTIIEFTRKTLRMTNSIYKTEESSLTTESILRRP